MFSLKSIVNKISPQNNKEDILENDDYILVNEVTEIPDTYDDLNLEDLC